MKLAFALRSVTRRPLIATTCIYSEVTWLAPRTASRKKLTMIMLITRKKSSVNGIIVVA